MKFKVLVNELTLKKENIKKVKGDVFEINDEGRAQEILNYRFNGKPVVEPFFYDEKMLEMETKIKELEETNTMLYEENENLKTQLEEANNFLALQNNEKTDAKNSTSIDDEKNENVHDKSKSKK